MDFIGLGIIILIVVGIFIGLAFLLLNISRTTTAQLSQVEQTLNAQLTSFKDENAQELSRMRETVDTKLSKTLDSRLSSSFQTINRQLEAVNRGLGDMQNLASSVGDLQKVLSNVKTRGNLGEVQLSAILSDILAPSQYEENVETVPGTNKRVEFAVRIPTEGSRKILLPIDAKFPGDTYARLVDATEEGDTNRIAEARKRLVDTVKREAKDISSKYISVPHTTNYALMFLPFEGLYAEIVQNGDLIETLARDYCVTVAGPSTMAALLNSLQLSYQTFAIQKQTDDILRILQGVKAEIPKYQEELIRAKKQIDTAGKTVETLITTRTNVMERKLKDISLPAATTSTSAATSTNVHAMISADTKGALSDHAEETGES